MADEPGLHGLLIPLSPNLDTYKVILFGPNPPYVGDGFDECEWEDHELIFFEQYANGMTLIDITNYGHLTAEEFFHG